MNYAFETLYIITSVVVIYSFYNFMMVFVETKDKIPRLDIMIIAINLIISTIIHYYINVPIANLLLTIIFLVAIGYTSGLRKQKLLLAIVFSIIFIISIEILVAVATGFVTDSLTKEIKYNSIFGRVVYVVTVYVVSVALNKLKKTEDNTEIPIGYWLSLVLFPLSSIYLLLIILRFSGEGSITVVISAIIVMLLNVLIFTLYGHIIKIHRERVEELTARYLMTSYEKQLEMMKKSVKNTKSIEHDINKHLTSIETLASAGDDKAILEYVEQIKTYVSKKESIVESGNLIVDSIINFEYGISDLDMDSISVDVKNVPGQLLIEDYDFTVILSNLLNNAFEAVSKLENGHVKVQLDYQKNVLFISVMNDYNNEIEERDGLLLSTKKMKSNHGYGLSNVKKSVKRYDGEVEIEHSNGIFKAEVIMYNVEKNVK